MGTTDPEFEGFTGSSVSVPSNPQPKPPLNMAASGAVAYVPRIVEALRDLGGKAKTSTVRAAIVDAMIAREEFIDETELSNGEPRYQADMRFARLYLLEAGKLEPMAVSGFGVWQLTPEGWNMPLDSATIASICKKNPSGPTAQATLELIQDELPEVAQGDLALQKLLLQLSDIGFERLCAAIMTANNAEVHVANGKAGDGGIDGSASFSLDSLSLVSFRVAWQCKRYASDKKVTPAAIREFRGALDRGFQHGVFFTTSTLTVSAEDEARRAGQIPIRIVDISGLIKMLKGKELGLTKQSDNSYLIDHAYFEKFKSTGITGWNTQTLFSKKKKAKP